MALSETQLEQLDNLESYVDEMRHVEKSDFDDWAECKKEFCVNIKCYIMLIKQDRIG